MLEGKPRDVVAHVMETADGTFYYDLFKDIGDGARFMREGAETSITDNRYGLEDNPVDSNFRVCPGWNQVFGRSGKVQGEPPFTDEAMPRARRRAMSLG